ncbi:MAG: hypothetical protein RI571_11885 [Roseovarius sp.]|jgi:hypothetical protein|nr:hypothetical protein [Roseovarius sp.]
MQVVLHAGAHFTDDDRLLSCLTDNRDTLARYGTNVPSPRKYRKLLRDTVHAALSTGVSDESRDILIDAIAVDGAADRLVLANPGFFGTPRMAPSGGVFYAAAEQRLGVVRQIFPRDTIELFLAIRNPATFLPALLQDTDFETLPDLLRGADPMQMRWSELIRRIRAAHPEISITVWCNEDTPLTWAQLIRELAGLDPTVAINGEFALLEEIMSAAGMKRFRAYLDQHPGMTEVQKRRVIAAFLDKFADESAIEEELEIPGWTEEMLDALSDLYDDDVHEIQRITGVQMITP